MPETAATAPAGSAHRLRNERQFVDGEGLRSLRARTLAGAPGAPVLLDDDQVAHFLANGFLMLTPRLPAAFHAQVYDLFLDTPLPPEEPAGENPPDGAILDYYLTRSADEVTLDALAGPPLF